MLSLVAGDSDVAFVKAISEISVLGLLALVACVYAFYQYNINKGKNPNVNDKVVVAANGNVDRLINTLVDNAEAMNAVAEEMKLMVQAVEYKHDIMIEKLNNIVDEVKDLEDLIAPRRKQFMIDK